MGSKPTSKKRNRKQKAQASFTKSREELQLMSVLPTTPEGALRDERVDPATQGNQQLPQLVREALKQNWATPDVAKPAVVGALLEPFYQHDVVLDKDGNQVKVPPNRKMLLENAKALKELDQTQWERDHPTEAGKAKGGVTVPVQVNNLIDWAQITGERAADPAEQRLKELDEQIENKEAGHEEKKPEGQANQVGASEAG